MFAEKSWGSFQIIDVEDESLTIKVTLNAGHGMNYHSHAHRHEVWTVVSGEGTVLRDGGERNFKVEEGHSALKRVEEAYINKGEISNLDGLSVDMGSWRFNLRASNTEPLLRLNVESRGNRKLCMDKAEEILRIVKDD